jgi:hypothetical protein
MRLSSVTCTCNLLILIYLWHVSASRPSSEGYTLSIWTETASQWCLWLVEHVCKTLFWVYNCAIIENAPGIKILWIKSVSKIFKNIKFETTVCWHLVVLTGLFHLFLPMPPYKTPAPARGVDLGHKPLRFKTDLL